MLTLKVSETYHFKMLPDCFIGFRLHHFLIPFDRKKISDEVEILNLAFGVTKPPCFLNGGILFCNDSASNSADMTDILILKLKEKKFKSQKVS